MRPLDNVTLRFVFWFSEIWFTTMYHLALEWAILMVLPPSAISHTERYKRHQIEHSCFN